MGAAGGVTGAASMSLPLSDSGGGVFIAVTVTEADMEERMVMGP
jgi:hypothetical protein